MTEQSNELPSQIAQVQFLTVLSREDAWSRWIEALQPEPRDIENVALLDALGRVAAETRYSGIDNPPFDRALVDGFAVRASDVAAASDGQPVTLRLNDETIACGHVAQFAVTAGTATPIATGAPLPRGADAVIMIEWTDPGVEGTIEIRRAASPGAFVGFAASDIARGETLLRRGRVIGAREIAMCAACGIAEIAVWRRPRIAVISTGDELVDAGQPLKPSGIYDCNGPAVAAALIENGCAPTLLPPVADDADAMQSIIAQAFATHDGVLLSAGTSKGAGDLTYRLINGLGAPGIIAHGVALKPGKPLCLAVCGGKPVVALPGFPTSALFTFHDMVAPALRMLAGLPPRPEANLTATLAVDAPSELGRREFVMVALVPGREGVRAFPSGKGSGAVTSFTQADGFISIGALEDHVAAGSTVTVTRFGRDDVRPPDITVIGSHCTGLEALFARLEVQGVKVRFIAAGSQGGLMALARGEADVAPMHLLDAKSDTYNTPFLQPTMRLIPGWRRTQGFVFRKGDARFAGKSLEGALASAFDEADCMMVSRNAGSGTRILIDRLLGGRRPLGYANAPRSHNAVAASVLQGRGDWGVAIFQAAKAYGLDFIAIGDEHYDFAIAAEPRSRNMIAAFKAALNDADVVAAISEQGFVLRR